MTYGGSRRPDLAARLRRGQRTLKSRLERPEDVLALLRAAHDSLDPESSGKLVVNRAEEWFKASAYGVFAPDLDGQVIGLASKGVGETLAPAATGVARWVIGHGREFGSADLRKDSRAMGTVGAVLAWPLRCRAQTIAALVVMERQAAQQVPQLAAAVGDALGLMLQGPAQALDNALRLRRSEALSVTDDLTQLYNSRYLNQVLRREAKRASRSGRPLSLLFLDLDGFKGINDTHGHQAGSRALVEAAAVIRRCARETDVVARFGGDEFALILPDTGSEGAAAVGDRVRERLAAHSFLQRNGLNLSLTASVGVATLPDVAASAEELVRAADMAMYQVKESGKNGIRVAQAE
ncbi:MAG: GGDEF domain-containing protein [Vicinamibacterales bacterium]